MNRLRLRRQLRPALPEVAPALDPPQEWGKEKEPDDDDEPDWDRHPTNREISNTLDNVQRQLEAQQRFAAALTAAHRPTFFERFLSSKYVLPWVVAALTVLALYNVCRSIFHIASLF